MYAKSILFITGQHLSFTWLSTCTRMHKSSRFAILIVAYVQFSEYCCCIANESVNKMLTVEWRIFCVSNCCWFSLWHNCNHQTQSWQKLKQTLHHKHEHSDLSSIFDKESGNIHQFYETSNQGNNASNQIKPCEFHAHNRKVIYVFYCVIYSSVV